ncbi:Hypothetical predicted protein [Podarcis lilfordi]|uniref:Uncharacterized protein n=1 Tax=Podarcis lilfordi TaxID=74358 RepID=A0AA35P839_9SAUR|nr:Hypothetical predicted protein [Podarcis lilfordi]
MPFLIHFRIAQLTHRSFWRARPPLSQAEDLPGTPATLFSDSQFTRAGTSSWSGSAAVQTRSWARSAAILRAEVGRLCRGRPAVITRSLLVPLQNKQPRVQLPESGTLSVGEKQQQEEELLGYECSPAA